MEAVDEKDEKQARKVTDYVIYRLEGKFKTRTSSVEEIQVLWKNSLLNPV